MTVSLPSAGNPKVDYAIPLKSRAPKTTLGARLRVGFAALVFSTGCICINSTQFLLLPLKFFPPTRALYANGMRYTKAAAAILFMVMAQFFAPNSIRLTYDTSRLGHDEVADWIVRDPKTGRVKSFNWPKKLVIVSNHLMYADWLYLWLLAYFAKVHAYLLIILKKSLKWTPVLGWAMQFFDFIFLERSWAADRVHLTSRLSKLAEHHMTTTTDRAEDDEPLALIIFPEGDLANSNTLPASRKYAEKMGIEHPQHMLLPRSTGLHTTLLGLSQLPSLYLMDVTVGYPGVPRNSDSQAYYTLRSIFWDGIPPPEVHYHVRFYNVQREIPLRAESTTSDTNLTPEQRKILTSAQPHLLEATADDKKVFDKWLRDRWAEKDEMIEKWYQCEQARLGTGNKGEQEVVIPLELRNTSEVLDAFCWFAPVIAGYVFSKFGGGGKAKTA